MLPSRPVPSQAQPSFGTSSAPAVLHAANLIDCARVGGAVVSPDGSLACFAVRQYSWDEKKFDNQLWIADLATAASLTDEERQYGQSPPSAGPISLSAPNRCEPPQSRPISLSLAIQERAAHAHLTQLTAGSQHAFSSASDPQWSPCGKYVAFLSDRGGDKTSGSAVWIAPARGPGEARLLASFPVAVSGLEWNPSPNHSSNPSH